MPDPVKMSEALLDAASAGDAAKIMAIVMVALTAAVILLGRALLAERGQRILDEKQHSKELAERDKTSQSLLAEIKNLIAQEGRRP